MIKNYKYITIFWIKRQGKEVIKKRNEFSKDIQKYNLDIGLENLVSDKGIIIGNTLIRNNSTSIFRQNDILFGRLRSYLNKWWLASEDGIKSNEIWAIFPTTNNYYLFIYYLIQTNQFLYRANISSGTRMPRSSWENIEKYYFKIPLMSEQKKIGSILHSLENIITLEHQRKQQLVALKQALYQLIFKPLQKKYRVNTMLSQEEINVVKFESIIKTSFKGTIKVSDLKIGDTEYLDTKRLNGGVPYYCNSKPNVKKDNILILWDGSKAGKIYSGFNGVLGSTLKAYDLINDVDSRYIYHYLKSNETRISHSYTTPNIPHVVRDFDSLFKIVLPSLEKQKKIGKTLTIYHEIIKKQNEKLAKYKLIKKLLLSTMFV